MFCSTMPASACCKFHSSLPGPGDSRMPLGLRSRNSSIVFSSFLKTICSQPKSPKYCMQDTGTRSDLLDVAIQGHKLNRQESREYLTQVVREAIVVVYHYDRALAAAAVVVRTAASD